MADLGSIGDRVGGLNTSPAQTISGTVLNDAGGAARRIVRLHLRSTGALVNEVQSRAENGAYEVGTTVLFEGQAHTAVFLDDDPGTQYNALVLDRLTPG